MIDSVYMFQLLHRTEYLLLVGKLSATVLTVYYIWRQFWYCSSRQSVLVVAMHSAETATAVNSVLKALVLPPLYM